MAVDAIKKLGGVILRCLAFFAAWLALVVIPVPQIENIALNRLLLEAKPLLCVAAVTVAFFFIDRKTTRVTLIKRPPVDTLFGLLVGGVWTFASIGAMFVLGGMDVLSKNAVPAFAVWALAMFLNAAMQELLVRGYMFSLIAKRYNTIAAVIFSILFFALLHPAFADGEWLATINLCLASLLFTLLLVRTENLTAPIIAHGIWNIVGALVFGAVSVADDYPRIYNAEFNGSALVSGGVGMLEGSAVTTVTSLVIIFILVVMIKNKGR